MVGMLCDGQAGELRDREMELKAQIVAVTKNDEGDEGPIVTEENIKHIVSTWIGIPIQKVSIDESDKILKMEETLHHRIIGKNEAVIAISRAIR